MKRTSGVATLSATILALAGISLAGCDRDRANTTSTTERSTVATAPSTTTTNGSTAAPTTSANPGATAEGTAGTTTTTTTTSTDAADPTLTVKVKTSFLADPAVKGLAINVDTMNGVVSLSGTVKSQAEADRAVQLASATEGVKSVQNNLTVSR